MAYDSRPRKAEDILVGDEFTLFFDQFVVREIREVESTATLYYSFFCTDLDEEKSLIISIPKGQKMDSTRDVG